MDKPFDIADWRVDPAGNTIARGGQEKHLEPRVMDLLVYLARRPGEVLSKNQIFRDVWHNIEVGESALLTAISSLRRALEDNPRHPRIIETVPKRGYRLVADTTAPSAAIAVLPFRHVSLQPDQDFLAEGISELLVGELGQIPGLQVISWPSAAVFRDSRLPVDRIGTELGARFIVEGTVALSGDRVRITARMTDASDHSQVWSENYERRTRELMALQRDLAVEISRSISTRLSPPPLQPEISDVARSRALMAYLRGRFHWNRMSPRHFDLALEYFEQAVADDPGFGPAYSGIADVWGAYGYWGMRPMQDIRERVWKPLQRAHQLEEEWAEVHVLTGTACFLLDRDWNAAEKHLSRAIHINPNLAHAHLIHGLLCITLARADAGDWLAAAERLDPVNPVMQLARTLQAMSLGDLDGARRYLKRLLELDPAHPPGNQLLTNLAWQTDDPQARDLEARIWASDPNIHPLFQEDVKPSKPNAILLKVAGMLKERALSTYVQPMQIARALCIGGDIEGALDILEDAQESGDLMQIDFLQSDCIWSELRDHPRYQHLLSDIGIPSQ